MTSLSKPNPASVKVEPFKPPQDLNEHQRGSADPHGPIRELGSVPSDPTNTPADGTLWFWYNTASAAYKVKLGDGTVHTLAPASEPVTIVPSGDYTLTGAPATITGMTHTAVGAGFRLIHVSLSVLGAAGAQYRFYVYVNGAQVGVLMDWRPVDADRVQIAGTWAAELADGDVVTIRGTFLTTNGTVYANSSQAVIWLIGQNGAGGGGGGPGTDTTAIHDDTAGEIAAITEKATPVAADLIVIEDSAAANVKARVQLGNLPAASTTAKGISELATAAEAAAGTDAGRVPSVSLLPVLIQDSKYTYAADAGASDAYAITLVPAVTAYAAGQVFHFKANTTNTGTATLNVNGLGAKTIKKQHDRTLATGDIEAGQIVTVVYDGTDFIMQSQVAGPDIDPSGIGFTDGSAASDAAVRRDVDGGGNLGIRLETPLVLPTADPAATTGAPPDSGDSLHFTYNGLPYVGIKVGSQLITYSPGSAVGLQFSPGYHGGFSVSDVASPFLSPWGVMAGLQSVANSFTRASDATGLYVEIESTAAAAGIYGNANLFRADQEWWLQILFALAQTTSIRFFCGWSDASLATMLAGDTPTFSGYGLAYSTGVPDTAFRMLKGNAGVGTRAGFSPAFTVDTAKHFARPIWRLNAGGTLVSAIGVFTSAGAFERIGLPSGTPATNTIALNWMCGIRSIDGTSKKLRIYEGKLAGLVAG